MAIDSYSRMVSWLKILLPLAALALLSTLFLLSRAIDPATSIPFADNDIQERIQDQRVTGPFFSGTTSDGDQISFLAELLITVPDKPGSNRAEDVEVRIDLVSGTQVTLQSELAAVDMADDLARLAGDVLVTTSDGFEITTNELIARMSRLDLHSTGEISGQSPFGTLTAGQMRLETPAPNAGSHLIFTNGVKLLYLPKKLKE
jgi:lipopolysaccharide export system protein LptC